MLELARRDDELIANYIEQFNSRIEERRYDLAVDTAEIALDADPCLVVTNAALTKGQLAQSYPDDGTAIRASASSPGYAVPGREIARSLPDEPPLVYPDAQYWQDLTNRRKKYAQVDFAKTGSANRKSSNELDRRNQDRLPG